MTEHLLQIISTILLQKQVVVFTFVGSIQIKLWSKLEKM